MRCEVIKTLFDNYMKGLVCFNRIRGAKCLFLATKKPVQRIFSLAIEDLPLLADILFYDS